jgi:hypothetical protein
MNEYTLESLPRRAFYTMAEVSEVLRMDTKTVLRRLIKRRRIAYHQYSPGCAILIGHDDLVNFISGMRVERLPEIETEHSR